MGVYVERIQQNFLTLRNRALPLVESGISLCGTWEGALAFFDLSAKGGRLFGETARLFAWEETARTVEDVAKSIRSAWSILVLFPVPFFRRMLYPPPPSPGGKGSSSPLEKARRIGAGVLASLPPVLYAALTLGKYTKLLAPESLLFLKMVADSAHAAKNFVLGIKKARNIQNLSSLQGEEASKERWIETLEVVKNCFTVFLFFLRAFGAALGAPLAPAFVLYALSYTGALSSFSAALLKKNLSK